MRNFVFGSFLLFVSLFLSCASIERSGCETIRFARTDFPPLITPSDSLQIFDMEMAFMGNTISGMLMVKLLATGAVRVKVQNYFGLSMMDLEFTSDSLTVHHIFEALNKPSVIKMFEEDFRLIFGLNLPEHFSAQRCACKDGSTVVTVLVGEAAYRYHITVSGRFSEIKSPFVRVKNKSNLAGSHDIILKHPGVFGPTVVIRRERE